MSITQYPPAGGGSGGNIGDEVVDFLLTGPSGAALDSFLSDEKYLVAFLNRMVGIIASQTAMDAVIASQTAMDEVSASQTVMDEVAASQTVMDAVAASQAAMDAVAASQTAMDAVAASQIAMDAVAASSTALTAIFDSWLAREAIWDSVQASNILMDTSNSNTWMRNNVASVNSTNSESYGIRVDKKVFVLQAHANTDNAALGGGYRYIQPGDETYSNGARHNVARTDRVQPLQTKTEEAGRGPYRVTYVQMQQ